MIITQTTTTSLSGQARHRMVPVPSRVGRLAKQQFQDRLNVRAFDANPLSQDEGLDWMAWRQRNKDPDSK